MKQNAQNDLREILSLLEKSDSINNVDAGFIEEMKNAQIKLKKEQVLKVHQNKICKTNITKNGKQMTVYQTHCGNQRPRKSSEAALIEWLYDFYFLGNHKRDYSIAHIYEEALGEKSRTENIKQATIEDYEASFRNFLPDSFKKRDIRDIKPSELKEFIQQWAAENQPKKKKFLKFKSLLNLIFNYAVDPERRYISFNPMPLSNKAFRKNIVLETRTPEEKAFQPNDIEKIKAELWKRVEKEKYDVNGYAVLFSIETGVREGEIPSLKWSDIHENYVHIHSQQNVDRVDGKKHYYYNESTKDEKGQSRGGRKFPMTDKIRLILDGIKKKQEDLGIETEWVFAKITGEWITTAGYTEALFRLCKKLELTKTNNHAFRMALNSYVFVPAGLEAPDRAKLLGHSVETNLRYYTFSKSDEYINEMCERLNDFGEENDRKFITKNAEKSSKINGLEGVDTLGTPGTPKVIDFSEKRKALKPTSFKALS